MDIKLDRLKSIIKRMDSLLVAYSGGLDSSFLLKVASEVLKDKVCALTAVSPTYSERETRGAKEFCRLHGIKHIIIETSEMKNLEFVNNSKERCYVCKRELFTKCLEKAKELGFAHVADGANVDDLSDFRPGDRAARELGIRRPLLEAEFTKEDIRKYSRELNLATWDKPSYACLASRFTYGTQITEEKLKAVDEIEVYLKNLGFKQVRLRNHNDIARIEVGSDEVSKFLEDEDLRENISRKIKEYGFIYVTLDLNGYRTGSMNESK